jgi:D-alanyl-D-alanine carboxypeptidase
VGVIVLTNTNDSNPDDIAQQLMATVGQATAKAAVAKPASVAWDSAWERFAGLYRGRFGPNVDDPVTLEPLGSGRFRFVAPTGGGVVGEVVRFVEENGRPMRMYIGDSWIDRVRAP